jgi:hypothetical protein
MLNAYMSSVFHYITGDLLKEILDANTLTPTRTEPQNENEIPSITFSKDPDWEKTRCRVAQLPDGNYVLLTRDLLEKHCHGLFRIVVPAEIAPLDWKGIKEELGMSKSAIQAVYDLHVQMGARTSDWSATTKPVPVEQWTSVEHFRDGKWQSMPTEESFLLIERPVERISGDEPLIVLA